MPIHQWSTQCAASSPKTFDCLVVVDHDGYLAGVITRADVLRCYLEHDTWEPQPVGDYMTSEVVTVSPDEQLRKVADLLQEKHIHRIVVVQDEHGKQKPVAVVSDTDLVYHLMKDVE